MTIKTLDDLLQEWSVLQPGDRDPAGENVRQWYAVANDEGIIAYFGNEWDAFRFRLAEINRALNG